MSELRCRPGDLAVVVGKIEQAGCDQGMLYGVDVIGAVVRCVSVDADGDWTIEPQHLRWKADSVWIKGGELRYFVSGEGCPSGFPDRCLQPLRDPGEDAVDETLEWLPVPAPATA